MRFQRVGRTDADKVFINVRNVSATALSAHVPVELDCVTVTDGNAVTACRSGSLASVFVGILDQALADSAYGECQVYGFRQSAYISRASAGGVVGMWLVPVGAYFDNAATMSAATTSGHTYVTLAETITASAAYSSAAQVYTSNVFIRAM